MQACTTIFNRFLKAVPVFFMALAFAAPVLSYGQNPGPSIPSGEGSPSAPAVPKKDETNLFDGSSPYLDYGDFNLNEEENQDSQYFQYGRFFALSLGLGYETATGNRGKLYDSALPRFDARMQYWFGFHFAGDLGIFIAKHNFTDGTANYEAKLIGYGFHLKYYFDVKDSAAPVTFANPFLMGGLGAISKSQTSGSSTTPETDSTMSIDIGGGLEFPVVYKQTYLSLELLYHTQNFTDTTETIYAPAVPDLQGGFLTLMAHFMFVW